MGHIPSEELVALYSSAHYVLYLFSDEVFGYIPVESMSCGTPVLTYGWQGPGETVVDGVTGWLARDDEEMVRLATSLERDGYPSTMRNNCRKHGMNFDVRRVAKKMDRTLEKFGKLR